MSQPPPESPYGNNPNDPNQPGYGQNQPGYGQNQPGNQYGNQPNPYGDQGGQQPYGNQQYGGQPPAKRGKGLAIAALVLGILALLSSITIIGGILLGLLAVILGIVAAAKAKKGTGGGRGLAITGIVLGVLGIVISGAIIAFGVSLFGDIQSCVEDNGGGQAAIEQCEQELNEQFQN